MTVTAGGKPSKGTSKDKRLKENKDKASYTPYGPGDPHLGRRMIAAARMRRDEDRVGRAVEAALKRHLDHAEKAIGSMVAAAAPPDAFNLVSWDTSVDDEVSPVIKAVLEGMASGVIDFLSLPPDIRAKFLGEIDVSGMAQTFVDRIKGIGPEIAADLETELQLGVGKGEAIPKLAGRIQHVFDVATSRGTTIARTEVHGAAEMTSHEAATAIHESGVLTLTKTWISTADDRTRGNDPKDEFDHVAMDGETVGMDEPFNVDGDEIMYPGDPDGAAGNVINCRCSVIYNEETDNAGGSTDGADTGDE